DQAVTVADLPTAFWHEWVAALDEGVPFPASLRLCVIGGERARPDAAAAWARLAGGVRLLNSYGPTETTVTATAHESGAHADPRAPVPIGRPVTGVRACVLDARMRPVPIGVPGELYLGGAGLARGYLGRPALTAAAFVPDPLSGEPGARLYRTGDRVRWRADRALDFLGRIDDQVKLRGFRVEPGEIEAVLRAFPGVRDVVVTTPGEGAERRLAAYVAPASVELAALRKHAAAHLPGYMVPSAWALLDALPLTPSGKVDRRALPAPDFGVGAGRTAPRTPTEEMVAGIWAGLLGVERVGAGDSFFELGGHSLLATRLVSRVREAFGVEVPMRAVFEDPVLSGFAAKVDEALRAAAAEGADDGAPPLVPVPRDADLPLSYGQERFWVMDRLGAGPLALAAAIAFPADADADALERALAGVAHRHEALRTVFRASGGDGGAVQVVLPPSPISLPVDDLRALAAGEAGAAVQAALAAAGREAMDLERGPLLAARLLRLADASLLVVSVHHAVFDGWSTGVLERELRALYEAFSGGLPSPLAPLPVQYADWAVWQRREMESGALEAQAEFWRRALAGAPAVLELPADRPAPAARTHAGARRFFHLPPEVVEPARALARRENATLFMVLLAAYDVLLARLAGTDDVVVGTSVAGRTRAETEGLIGFFVNNLALRTDLSGDPSFRELLGRVRRTALDAYAHQDVPFQTLVDELLGAERTLGHSPVFQASLILQPAADGSEPAGDGIPDLPREPVERPAELELTFDLHEVGRGIVGVAAYSTERFDHETVERFVAEYRRLLDALLAEPDAPVSAPPAMDEAERRLVVESWNETAAEAPRAPLHRLFEARAEETPEALALVSGAERLSFAELNARANRLARRLAALGVGPESIVALALERSAEMVVALLAVSKAGGAFLPVDPTYPAERRRWMLEDSGARLVLTASALDEMAGEIASESDANLPVEVDVENAAYVIFTSGSTGRPKGVVVPHRGIGNLAAAQREAFGVEPGGRVLQFASFSFDAAVAEVAHALLSGAALVMARPEQAGPELIALLREEAVSVATLPPTLLAALPDADLPDLRTMVSAGEAVSAEVVARWGAGRRFVNAYGPTETTVCATLAVDPATDGPPPIGKPIANVRAYVLDARLRPVPIGVPGELCVGGIGVARGYLGKPGQTAERFVPDPFSADAGARLYRTGDRVRWKESAKVRKCESAPEPHGDERTLALSHSRTAVLEFLGRVDAQVKVRGFRIEPGEVEAALRAHASVREAVVVARHDPPAPARLVAYVVPADGVETDADALR
ncbi:MAG TPA: amino acid adenylation domain-containing protein, partial [Longimicrobiaceae bacterium]|nr:amino acid adenylation domain-containing protein [Longimicrobiaceae bacterium]